MSLCSRLSYNGVSRKKVRDRVAIGGPVVGVWCPRCPAKVAQLGMINSRLFVVRGAVAAAIYRDGRTPAEALDAANKRPGWTAFLCPRCGHTWEMSKSRLVEWVQTRQTNPTRSGSKKLRPFTAASTVTRSSTTSSTAR